MMKKARHLLCVATGRIKCTLPSWSSWVYKISRIDLDICKDGVLKAKRRFN